VGQTLSLDSLHFALDQLQVIRQVLVLGATLRTAGACSLPDHFSIMSQGFLIILTVRAMLGASFAFESPGMSFRAPQVSILVNSRHGMILFRRRRILSLASPVRNRDLRFAAAAETGLTPA
jgi:hypothetical protein